MPVPGLTVGWLLARAPFAGGEYYRATRPAALAHHHFGWETVPGDRVVTGDPTGTGKLGLLAPGGEATQPSAWWPDVLIIRPIANWSQHWTNTAHEAGQVVLADLDDSPWDHERAGEIYEDDEPDEFTRWFPGVDAALVSTKYLAKRIRGLYPTMPVVVAPNCYDPFGFSHAMTTGPRPGGNVGSRLWLGGRMSGDLEMFYELLFPVLDDLGLGFTHIGAVNSDGSEMDWRGQDTHFHREGVEERPSCTLLTMPTELERLSIGAIMMCEQAFNLSKTETAAMEYGCCGVPIVAASNHELYRSVPGRVAPTRDAIRDRLVRLQDEDYWRFESARILVWARALAKRSEERYLSSLLTTVRRFT